ncbi:Cellulose synthesis regulatory protein [Actinoplanes sp. SE50]|uniref:GGDEF domain-containing protein n=1 Tax=unclassified Actinoplanes TaxID=2626549 RepID=UPI00023ECF0C|nr:MULTISPECIES: GGDEF domain-containing protein [unclassified Actinoplanes]AEV86598.1 Cellulose synthesis regulatory protein [Actinoplanes sp. SE50/110]ATO84996.1 Cellulose synthesis regulatory protein [Actinoplanes sp. SE50]SLM02405.1 hypothetical protein ACSP50_5654 [Actinoplanes sp. SE50/110]
MTGAEVRGKAATRAILLALTLGVCALAALAAFRISGRWPIAAVLAADLALLAALARIVLPEPEPAPEPAHDGVTGLPTRATLMAQVERTLPVADADQEPAGLVILGLDDLADVTETLGPAITDLLLRSVAARLTAALRDTDTLARIGPAEFAVLLPRVGSAAACLEAARRLRAAVQAPADLDGFQIRVDATAGGAVYPVHAATPTDLFARAGAAREAARESTDGAALHATATVRRSARPALPAR